MGGAGTNSNDNYETHLDWIKSEQKGLQRSSTLKSRQYANRQGNDRGALRISDIQLWRTKIIHLVEGIIGTPIFGEVAEIGAGRGIASAALSRLPNVDLVFSVDYSEAAVFSAMPETQSRVRGVKLNKIRRVLGDFNRIPDSSFDFIFAFGAMHNSPNLDNTFEAAFRGLKDDGFLVVSDLSTLTSTTKQASRQLSKRKVPDSMKRFGEENITFEDTSDFFYSAVDYVFSAKQAGFQVFPFVFNHRGSNPFVPPRLFKAKRQFGIREYYPRGSRGKYDRLLLIARKPKTESLGAEGEVPITPINRVFQQIIRVLTGMRRAT